MSYKQPNVIVIMTDDQGYGDMACHGNPVADTPHLDALHKNSMRLMDFHAAPMCTPTRGQLMTGLDAARNGAVNVSSGRALLRSDLPTMANYFADAGYATGLFGKWHLGDNYPYRPQDRGFQETLWFPSSTVGSVPDYWNNDYFDDVYVENGTRKQYEGYCTEVFFRETKKWIKGCVEEEKPFFAYLPTNAPHAPLYAPKEDRDAIEAIFAQHPDLYPDLGWRELQAVKRFLAMIRNVDTEIGALREFLEAEKVAQDTIIIFMTDNGSTFGSLYYNAGMRGAKQSLWEGGHRVPCFWHWPAGLAAGKDLDGLCHMQDILPTLLDFCNISFNKEDMDGISLRSLFESEKHPEPERMLCVNYSRMSAQFDYPSPQSPAIMRREGAAVMWKRWRLLEATALYDLDTDPGQEQNVIEQFPEVAKYMIEALDEWWSDVEEQANTPQYITIGHEAENPAQLTSCEWYDVFLDHQNHIRRGFIRNSYWHVDVEKTGQYRFRLRRWPEESGLAIRDKAPAYQTTAPGGDDPELGFTAEGRAFDIHGAKIVIGDAFQTAKVEDDTQYVDFYCDLKEGRQYLHTWFLDDHGSSLLGAYYVQVELLEPTMI